MISCISCCETINQSRDYVHTHMHACACTRLLPGGCDLLALPRFDGVTQVSKIAKAHGGLSGGASAGKSGYDLTFAIAYLRDFALLFHVLGESFETFVSWSALEGLCERVSHFLFFVMPCLIPFLLLGSPLLSPRCFFCFFCWFGMVLLMSKNLCFSSCEVPTFTLRYALSREINSQIDCASSEGRSVPSTLYSTRVPVRLSADKYNAHGFPSLMENARENNSCCAKKRL